MTSATKTVNYTDEQAQALAARYMQGESTDALATAFGKTARSVIAKLSQLGVYKKAETKEATSRLTKADIVASIAAKLEVSTETLKTFEKADKAALEAMFKAL